jgi:crossover junction endodeoxyribonuclease RuvC
LPLGDAIDANRQSSSSILVAASEAESKMMLAANNIHILGVDPGIRGGLAIVSIGANAAPCLIDAIDIPVAGIGAKERVDVLAIHNWIAQHAPQYALIERAQAMPKRGASSGFKYGRAVGAIEAVITCCGIPLTIIEPTAWKKFHQLRGGDKEAGSRKRISSSVKN